MSRSFLVKKPRIHRSMFPAQPDVSFNLGKLKLTTYAYTDHTLHHNSIGVTDGTRRIYLMFDDNGFLDMYDIKYDDAWAGSESLYHSVKGILARVV